MRRLFLIATTWLALSCGGDPFTGKWGLSDVIKVVVQSTGGGTGTRNCTFQWGLDVSKASPGYSVSWFGCATPATSAGGGTLALGATSCAFDAGQSMPSTTTDCRDIGPLSFAPCPYVVTLYPGSKLDVSGDTMTFDGGWHGVSGCSSDTFDLSPTGMSGTRQ